MLSLARCLRTLKNETWFLIRSFYRDQPAVITTTVHSMLVFLVVIAHVLTSVYVINFFAWITGDPDWPILEKIHEDINLGQDRSLGEIVNYGVAFLASVLFLLAFIENRSIMLLLFSTLMLFVWFDDAASYHERFGEFLSETTDLPILPRLKPHDTGEVLAWALAGLLFLPLFLLALFKRRPGDLGALAIVSFGFGLLVACGVLADLIHAAVPPPLGPIFSIVEDGGEMLAIVWIAGVALCLTRNGRKYYKALQSPTADSGT